MCEAVIAATEHDEVLHFVLDNVTDVTVELT
jgi:hypothetical protein